MNITTICLAVLLIALAGFGVGHRVGSTSATTKAEATMAAHLLDDSDAMDQAILDAQKATETLAEANNKAAEEAYQKGYKNAELEGTAVVADLRTGNLQLRRQWAGCEAQRMPDGAGLGSDAFAGTRDREDGSGRLVRAAAQCDAQVIGLQNSYNNVKRTMDEFNLKQRNDSSRR